MSGTRARVTVGIPTYNRAARLRETMESVLAQTHRDFRLVVSDNASEDETQDVVASFGDPRIEYTRLTRNIGMIANFNRLIELAHTDFLVLLPDDDLLYPDYLRAVLEVLDRYPSVGAVHTAFHLIGSDSTVLSPATNLLGSTTRLTIESRDDFLRRALSSEPIACFPSVIYRTRAIRESGGLRAAEEPFSDNPMWMRIGLRWGFAFLSTPLAAFRVHADSSTSQLGAFTGSGYELRTNRIVRSHRRGFLDEAAEELGPELIAAYRELVERTFRADEIQALANDAGRSLPWGAATVRLVRLVREDPRVLGLPRSWRLLAAQFGGRHMRRALSLGLTPLRRWTRTTATGTTR